MAESTSSIYKTLSELLHLEKYFIRKVILLSSLAGLFSLAIPVGVQLLLTFVTAQEVRPGMYAILILILFFVWLNGRVQIRLMKEGENVEQRLFVQLAFTYLGRILNQNPNRLIITSHLGRPTDVDNKYSLNKFLSLFNICYYTVYKELKFVL